MSLARLEKIAYIVAAAMLAASLLWKNVNVSFSLLAGAAISIGSFMLMRLFVGRALTGDGAARIIFGIAAALKLMFVAIVLWAVMTYASINAIALMVGLSVLVVSIFIEALVAHGVER